MANASQTCGRFNARSSRRDVASRLAGVQGTKRTTAAAVTRASTAPAANAERQPNAWPSQVASGTPATFARLSPSSTRATARARRSGPARSAAHSEATPK